MKRYYCHLLFALGLMVNLLVPMALPAQHLQPGFDKAEYIELMKLSARFGDSSYTQAIPAPQQYQFVYRSPVVGLDNRWDLWTHMTKPIAVISLRGTTQNSVSWLANFYSAMVPAKGELQLSEKEKFTYQLATDPKAAVHVGWLVSTAFLSKDILPKLDSCYKKGIKDMIIMGHSQGGAIAYLLTAYLYNLQKLKQLPADIRFKTYCSAGPKPGNLFFAYEYEAMTQAGWAYNVVNAADWVPEVPFSVQTLNDFNKTNPFVNAKGLIRKQKFTQRLVLNYVYNNLSKPALKAQKRYQKYLGRLASKTVRKNLNGYLSPEYYNSNNYVRTGNFIVLTPDESYYQKYPDNDTQVFVHHLHPPYLYLTDKLSFAHAPPLSQATPGLQGSWELTYISGPKIAFEELYPNKKPTIVFDAATQKVMGTTSCNSFNGPYTTDGQKLSFPEPLVMTRMFCDGQGEPLFVETLKKVTGYALTDDKTLTLLAGDIAVMRLVKK
jgi:heat shock protein HslJ